MASIKYFITCLLFIASTSSLATTIPTLELPYNKWRMISLPATPPESANTLEKIIGDNIGVGGTYGQNWTIYAYNPHSNEYGEPVSLSDTLEKGSGYWIIQLIEEGKSITLKMPQGSTIASSESIPLAPSKDGSNQWNLAGNPFSSPLNLGDLRLTTTALPCNDGNCNIDKAKENNLLHNKVWTYDGNSYVEKGTNNQLNPWDGFWIAALTESNNHSIALGASISLLSEGMDWSLPLYTTQSSKGGMTGGNWNDDPEVSTNFMEVVWRLSEGVQGHFDWDDFQQRLDATNNKVLVRLEVNSQCHAPEWASIPYLENKSLQFWKPEYVMQLKGFINAFANEYAGNNKIIGVHLGIADGEYYQGNNNSECPESDDFGNLVYGGGRDGWGEFWVNSTLGEDTASINNGLTPDNFEDTVKDIINMYVDAFGVHKNKLAFISYSGVFGPSAFDARLPSIINYAKAKGIGNREGEIEDWMRYTGNTYGVNLVTGNNIDKSCSMTFDEDFADSIQNKYWGDENEFYGPEDWVLDYGGPLSNQAYRFYMSSMRALQLRRNYISIRSEGLDYLKSINNQFEHQYTPDSAHPERLKTKFHSGDFITYLSKTLGRTRSDTPDAFVILGDKTLNPSFGLFPPEYKSGNTSEQCLIEGNDRGYVTINEFGRWLSVVSPTIADESMRKDMPVDEENWGAGNLISDRNINQHYELYARKSNEMLFDINDQLMQERCSNGCKIDVKISFKDDRIMGLQLVHTNGSSNVLTTQGGGQTRTVTFPVSGTFSNGYNNADFSIKTTDGSDLSVLMARINLLAN
ncbi:MAG: hypothetical protein V3U87_07500 [Methylococcaceae bacterium]